MGANVVVHAGRLWLRILDPFSRQCVREHTIALTKGSRRTADADRPKQTPPQVEKLVARVAQFGPACGTFARALQSEQGALCTRTLFGLLDLIRRYDVEPVERACALAATARSRHLHFLRAYLNADATPIPLANRHRIIAPIDTYATHFKTLTRGKHDDGPLGSSVLLMCSGVHIYGSFENRVGNQDLRSSRRSAVEALNRPDSPLPQHCCD